MTPTADIPLKEPVISAAASDTEQLERARIDASTRVPVLMFYASAMVWLLIGTLLAGFVSFKLHSPDWLSFPPYAAVVLFVAYALIISWAVLMFRFRRGDQIYITQWYLLGAFLWFPWLYAAAQAMLFVVPVQGVMQAAVGWWYANNLL